MFECVEVTVCVYVYFTVEKLFSNFSEVNTLIESVSTDICYLYLVVLCTCVFGTAGHTLL